MRNPPTLGSPAAPAAGRCVRTAAVRHAVPTRSAHGPPRGYHAHSAMGAPRAHPTRLQALTRTSYVLPLSVAPVLYAALRTLVGYYTRQCMGRYDREGAAIFAKPQRVGDNAVSELDLCGPSDCA